MTLRRLRTKWTGKISLRKVGHSGVPEIFNEISRFIVSSPLPQQEIIARLLYFNPIVLPHEGTSWISPYAFTRNGDFDYSRDHIVQPPLHDLLRLLQAGLLGEGDTIPMTERIQNLETVPDLNWRSRCWYWQFLKQELTEAPSGRLHCLDRGSNNCAIQSSVIRFCSPQKEHRPILIIPSRSLPLKIKPLTGNTAQHGLWICTGRSFDAASPHHCPSYHFWLAAGLDSAAEYIHPSSQYPRHHLPLYSACHRSTKKGLSQNRFPPK